MRALLASGILFALALGLTACGGGKQAIVPRNAPGIVLASITVTSPSFAEGGRIPVDCTCDGSEIMPEIVISSPPEGTKSLVFLVEDPDASAGVFTHMVVFNVSPDVRKLPAGQEITNAGENARWGLNDFAVAHYSGPCPPKGEAHRYRWRVLALDTMLKLSEGSPLGQVNEAMDGHILGEGMLTGQFGH
jgi:Raf kinase inhibitor-like YbhB/YbcL family protein